MSQNVDKPNNVQKLPSKYYRVKLECVRAQYAPLVLSTKGHKCCPVKVKKQNNKQYKAPSNWAQMTPYEVIRMNNCKSFQFSSKESYPSIRPTQFICSEKRTAEDVLDAVVNDCGSYFSMEKDDIVSLWKQYPDKNTLGFYGIDTESQQEDADAFNRLVLKCLEKVAKKEEKQLKIKTVPRKPRKESESLCDNLVLNHMLLQRKVYTMPTVKKNISAIHALETMNCPSRMRGTEPFVNTKCDCFFDLKSLQGDMEKCFSKKNHRPRRKHKYCGLNCITPENECTYLEWLKYKNDPKPYDKAFNEDMEEVQKLQMQAAEPEPKNYEELYEQLMECFENNKLDPLCEAYKACCLIKRKDDEGEGDRGEKDEGPKEGDGEVPKRFPIIGKRKKKPEDETNKGDKPDKNKLSEKKNSSQLEGPNKPAKDKQKTGKRKSDKGGKDKEKDNSGKEKVESGKEKLESGKDESEKVSKKPSVDKTDKHGKGKTDKEKLEKHESKDKMNSDDEHSEEPGKAKKDKHKKKDSDDTWKFDKSDDEGSEAPGKVDTDKDKKSSKTKTEIVQPSTEKVKRKKGKKEKKPKEVIPAKPIEEIITKKEEVPPKIETKKIKIVKPKLPEKPKEPVKVEEPVKDCPCKICEFKKHVSSDNVFIKKLKDEEKRRQLRNYYRKMCQHNWAKSEQIKCPAPQRRAGPIDFDNNFCCNPKLSEYSNCLKGMHELKEQLKCKYSNKDEVMSDMQNLIERMSIRFIECLN